MKDSVLSVKGLHKVFRKSTIPAKSNFREALSHSWYNLFKKNSLTRKEYITALQNLDFDLGKGDILGIVGRNGAGKTTLLKIMAGILQPTRGEVIYKGRLVSILELGAGFHPDLTGKENVYLNGALLGLSKTEINHRFDAIVEFSDSWDYINEPVKQYSNGMYLRLAFSIFTHLNLDILLLDEIMAVGDAMFRQKSYNQISALANSGTTIIMVSHNPHEIKDICNKCLWLEAGKMAGFGNTVEVVDQYLEESFLLNINKHKDPDNQGYFMFWPEGFSVKDEILINRFGIKACKKHSGSPILLTDDIEICMEFEKLKNNKSIEVTFCILSFYSTWILVESYGIYDSFHQQVVEKGSYTCKCFIPAGVLNFGVYQLGFLVAKEEKLIYQIPGLINFKIDFNSTDGVKQHLAKGAASILKPIGNWVIERGF